MVVRLVAGRFSRAERARQRQHLDLEDVALSDKTKVRYYSALRKLLPYYEKVRTDDDLDNALSQWVHDMWKSGEPLLLIGDGLSALHYFQPWTRRRLPHAWKLFSIWRKVEKPSRAPPLTQLLVRSMAAFEMMAGRLDMTVMLLLGFSCLLRTGELLQLKTTDFQMGPISGVCTLRNTKTSRRDSANEVTSFDDIPTVEAVKQLLLLRKQTNTGPWLWVHSAGYFRQQFNFLCDHFDLSKHKFRPYSLRRGGATHVFQQTQSMEVALVKGRWQSSRVARIYISDGLSYLPSITMSKRTKNLLQQFFFFSSHQG